MWQARHPDPKHEQHPPALDVQVKQKSACIWCMRRQLQATDPVGQRSRISYIHDGCQAGKAHSNG
eukprot:11972080-Alexandrium_andersonii.AAC.1